MVTSIDTTHTRLHPHWTNNRFFGLLRLRQAMEQAIGKHLRDARLPLAIDLGCGSMPYKPLFLNHVARYVGADIEGNPTADLVMDAHTGVVDIQDASADLVISTQVLEHVTSPVSYLGEAHRICKPNGLLFISTHGFWLYHPDPTDYWRWTGTGLRKMLGDNGWTVESATGILGFAAAATALMQDALTFRMPSVLRKPFTIVMQQLVNLFDKLYDEPGRAENAALYLIVARRADVAPKTVEASE